MLGLFAASADRSDYYSPYSDGAGSSLAPADWQTLVADPIREFFTGILVYLPGLITALCILAAGWLLGKLAQLIVSVFLKHIGFDKMADQAGLSRLLTEGAAAPHRQAGRLTFWIVITVTLIACLEQLNLQLLSSGLSALSGFIFSILTGLVIFIAGILLSHLADKTVRALAQTLNTGRPGLYAGTAKWGILVFTVLFCLMRAGLMSQVIIVILGMAALTLCITFILAFGIGGTRWAAKVLDKTMKEKSE
jgi:hypothetical protein